MRLPTTSPQTDARISIAGTALGGLFTLYSLEINHQLNRIPYAVLKFHDGSGPDQNFSLSEGNQPALLPGSKVSIDFLVIGDAELPRVFEGILVSQRIQVFQGKNLLILECRHPAVKMTLGRKTHCFLAKTDQEVLNALIAGAGLQAQVEGGQMEHASLIQYQCSDWDFLMQRAEANGILASLQGDAVMLGPPDFSEGGMDLLDFGRNLISLDLNLDATTQLAKAEALTWNAQDQEVLSVNVETNAVSDVPDQPGDLGSQELAKKLSAPSTQLRFPGEVFRQELESWALARLQKSRMARIQGWIETYGFQILPGRCVHLAGLGSRFNGEAFLTGVEHLLKGGLWITRLQFGLPEAWYSEWFSTPGAGNKLSNFAGLMTGKVVQIDQDPQGAYRALIRLSIVGERADIWARFAFPGAGPERGFVFWPEVGDEVIVGLMGGNPDHPVVLGQLYSLPAQPPFPPEASNPEKGIVTKTGMTMAFNDAQKSFRIVTPGGHQLELNEGEASLSLQDGNGNSLEMNSSGMTLSSRSDIKLQSQGQVEISAPRGIRMQASGGDLALNGLNVRLQASSRFEASGNTGAEMSTPAIASVKGALIKLN